ncbi:hypothetical protein H4R19_002970 [Coemansia spiralis]|nr:hypothetical protein H4R19_002970 [Coemansia spiralis]
MPPSTQISCADMARRVDAHVKSEDHCAACKRLRRQMGELAELDEMHQGMLWDIQDAQRRDARLEAKVEYFWTLLEDPAMDDITRDAYSSLIDFTNSFLMGYRSECHAWEYEIGMLRARMAIIVQDMNTAFGEGVCAGSAKRLPGRE